MRSVKKNHINAADNKAGLRKESIRYLPVSMFTAFDHSSFLERYCIQTYCTASAMVPETQLVAHYFNLLFILNNTQRKLHLQSTSLTNNNERERVKSTSS